jgi:hypothetical protein
MPAHRSSAEAEIRDAVVARLRVLRPDARIMHEINSCLGGNRIDVLAVSPADIVAVEIKSKKDKLDRLPAQIKAMQGVAHVAVSALHEKFCPENLGSLHYCDYERSGEFYRRDRPKEAGYSKVWAYAGVKAKTYRSYRTSLFRWDLPDVAVQKPLPADAIHILWSDELRWLCSKLRIDAPKRSNNQRLKNSIRWLATGGEVTRGICAALRRRECVEADSAISDEWRP